VEGENGNGVQPLCLRIELSPHKNSIEILFHGMGESTCIGSAERLAWVMLVSRDRTRP
jgi:hypothetical protein